MVTKTTLVAVIAVFVVLGNAKPVFRRDIDWQQSSDDNLTDGCSSSQVSCYNEQSLSKCGSTDYQCMCDAMAHAMNCLDDCNDGQNRYIASQAQSVYCEAAELYGSVAQPGSDEDDGDAGENDDDDATTTFIGGVRTTTDEDGETTTVRPTLTGVPPEVTFRPTTTTTRKSETSAITSDALPTFGLQVGGIRTSALLVVVSIVAVFLG